MITADDLAAAASMLARAPAVDRDLRLVYLAGAAAILRRARTDLEQLEATLAAQEQELARTSGGAP